MARILLIEDEKNIAVTMQMCLKAAGHTVVHAVDGLAALKVALSEEVDLVLLDLVLPNMSGFLVLEALKEDPRTASLPVIVTSARVTEEDIRRARDLGAQEYLGKPFTPQELIRAVDRVLAVARSQS